MSAVILIAVCLGTIPGMIASSKGRSFVEWWLYRRQRAMIRSVLHLWYIVVDGKFNLQCSNSERTP